MDNSNIDTKYVPILERLAQRLMHDTLSQLQHQFLEALHDTDLSNELTLVGGSALHGVYLHKRMSAGLDFVAQHSVASKFDRLAADVGLVVKRGAHGNTWLYGSSETAYIKAPLRVSVYLRQKVLAEPKWLEFNTGSFSPVCLQVAELSELIACKLGRLFRQPKPVDYLDVWFGLSCFREIHAELSSLLNNPCWHCYSHTPPLPFRSHSAVVNMRRFRSSWYDLLKVHFSTVPSFEVVESDLTQWLADLENL